MDSTTSLADSSIQDAPKPHKAPWLAQYRFQPGQPSANPTGRKKKEVSLSEYVRDKTGQGRKLVDEALRIVAGKGRYSDARASDVVAALQLLLERGWGKAPQQIELSGEVSVTHELRRYSLAQLDAMLVQMQDTQDTQPRIVEGYLVSGDAPKT